jgi:nitrate/nitrite transporter NarK
MAVVATILFPFSGPTMIFFVTPFACYFAYALARGYLFARRQEYGRHREWMIRAFAIATAIATQRLILVPALVFFGTEEDTIRLLSMLSFTSAFALHAVVSEYWLYTTREENALPHEFST